MNYVTQKERPLYKLVKELRGDDRRYQRIGQINTTSLSQICKITEIITPRLFYAISTHVFTAEGHFSSLLGPF